VLLSYCKCCIYKVFDDSILVDECRMCGIRQGIKKISNNNIWTESPELEYLGVC
jgi:hypothetical protein